ncbi:MAG: hypothetical protein M3010_02880 [Candidatus Dormibacteraeota bacterium]|nr:hypothetical protein [Candidatus Dormibacteraeota bacterium]
MKRAIGLSALIFLACSCPGAAGAASSSDPNCVGAYGGAAPQTGTPLRLGIDPGIAGSAGGVQLPSTPDDPTKDLAAVQALAPPGRQLVVRLNRLFWSDGQAGIDAFQQLVARYTNAGFEVELQVRYHPPSGQAGDISAWVSYVRHVVDTFGPNRNVLAMTITNEVNVPGSSNTSDGAYAGAQDALIAGIEAAHAEAWQRGFTQLRFGFTYAYRFSPSGDAGFFSYLGAHGGQPFLDALGFVGLDFYPGTIYPPTMAPGDTYHAELAQAAGTVRDCLAPQANIGASVPIWITENGVPTGSMSDAQQADALQQLVQAAHDYSGTYNITDYRWFNLRDSTSSGPSTLVGPTFASDGLLRDDYSPKPSFAQYRALIAALGAPVAAPNKPSSQPPRRRAKHHHRRHARHHRHPSRHRHSRPRRDEPEPAAERA